jgi:N-acyl-D-amino-acid deacylase
MHEAATPWARVRMGRKSAIEGAVRLASLLPFLLFAAAAASGANALAADYDLIIAGGRVVDGTGAPWFRADVGVRGDRIATVGELSSAFSERRVDAAGRVVAPGFIDMLGQSELE